MMFLDMCIDDMCMYVYKYMLVRMYFCIDVLSYMHFIIMCVKQCNKKCISNNNSWYR